MPFETEITLLWGKKSKVKANLPQTSLRHLLLGSTVFLPSCTDKSTVLCVGVIAWGLMLSNTDNMVQKHQMNHRSTLTVVLDFLQHSLFYELLPCTPRRHLSLQL